MKSRNKKPLLLMAFMLLAMPAHSAINQCATEGGLEQIVNNSYRDYNQGQFQVANQGIFEDLELILDSLHPLDAIPRTLPAAITRAADNLNMSICQEGNDLLYFYPNASLKSERPPVSFLWRVGDIVIPGDRSTYNNPVNPLFYQAPHFQEGRPIAVKLMRETNAKVMVLAANKHNGYPNYMNAARAGSSGMNHVFLDMSQNILEKYPQSAVMVLHGMRRKVQSDGMTSGMIQPGEGGAEMRLKQHFNLKSFNDLFAEAMGRALETVAGVDPRLKTELRAPNGSQYGIADLTGFLFSVNTDQVHGFSNEHVKRMQGIHFEMPQRMRYNNSYIKGSQNAVVVAMNKAMAAYKSESAFSSTSTPDHCDRYCRREWFQNQGVSLFSRSQYQGKQALIPIEGSNQVYYDIEHLPNVASLKFPEHWNGSITLHEDLNGQGFSESFYESDANIWSSYLSSEASSISINQPDQPEPAEPFSIEAEHYDVKSGGVRIERKGNRKVLGYIRTGNWVKYEAVDFGDGTLNTFDAQIASKYSRSYGAIKVYLDDMNNAPIATLTRKPGPGGWSNFKSVSTTLNQSVSGVHDLYLKFEAGYNLDSFGFRNN